MALIDANWEDYAKNTFSPIIRAHYYFTVWRNYRMLLFGLDLPSGSILEIGSSTGQISLRLSQKYSLIPTLVDNSRIALTLAKFNYQNTGIEPNLVFGDVLSLTLKEKFDVVHSHGLLEHFEGKNQIIAFRNHVKYLKTNGFLICWVPTPDWLYRINRWYLENTNQWIFGFERPIPLEEFQALFRRFNLRILRTRHMPGWIGILAMKSW